MKTAIELIAEERERQINAECWTLAHDDCHIGGELARAAATYALPEWMRESRVRPMCADADHSVWAKLWPWQPRWWKPKPDDRIRELTKAGALIVAEIERIQRSSN